MVTLSVCVTFCNQEKYIRNTLNSIVCQKTNFDYEVLIGLDGKKEESLKIIKEYTDKYDFIKVYESFCADLNCINIEKAASNRLNLIKHAKGKFFMLLDGDDYYGDEYKFQKQVDVLNANPKCIGCGSGHTLVQENGNMKPHPICEEVKIYSIVSYIQEKLYVHNCSITFRNIFYFGFPQNFPYNFVNDTTMTLYMLKFGNLAVLPDCSYMYRISAEGIYQGQNALIKNLYAVLGGEINIRYIPEYRKLLLRKYKKVFRKVFADIKKYGFESAELEKIYDFAKNNGCVLTENIIKYSKVSYFKKIITYLKCWYVTRKRRYPGKRKIWRMAVFSGFSNFGDMLNLYIARYIYGWCVIPNLNRANLYCVGSLLSRIFEGNVREKKEITIIGTGMHRDIVFPEKFGRKLNIFAIRGKKSQEKIKQLLGINVSITADPAVLIREIVKDYNRPKGKYIGVIPHFYDKNEESIKNVIPDNVKIITVEDTPIQVLRDMMDCYCILSSSLHGLIFADALGIPNKRVSFSDEIIGGDLKYEDYYSVYGKDYKAIDLRERKITQADIDDIVKNYVNVEEQMDKQCEELLKIKID
ncbi:MAG: glycosyltransferase [Alphaproteobacteria bacterium]|nr:glycosyltransferase [Alphaproteobacteria bacterium]